jgi:hypothetical protein
VYLDRLLDDAELGGDLFVQHAGHDEGKDLDLACSQRLDALLNLPSPDRCGPILHILRHGPLNGSKELLAIDWLEVAQYVVGGVAPQIWYFSVRDEVVAEQLFKAVGQNVQLRYTEHRGIPTSCFGDTPYFAQSFTIIPTATR